MENEELIHLRDLKEQLLEEVVYLKDKLKDQEENGCEKSTNFNTRLFPDDEDHKLSESMSTKYKAKLCNITAKVMGITFKDIDRKWLHDNVYIYIAKVITKTISIDIELTVILKNLNNDFEIKNLKYEFSNNVHKYNCDSLEISPWIEEIINKKNFSLLMSGISDYEKNCILRSKILHSSEIQKYVSIEQHTLEYGVYRYRNGIDLGMEFSEKNRFLLKKLCKYNLTKNNLMELWKKLCIAIDAYAGKNA
ncbi:PREDICTED: uncharacterized protein LOC108777868 [Cyphomyrmex costatus]|uniref:uncharacterized protein LOC108777868 n=1 Tax=Cyphomyrmex costatus TaxID=456900 RepID=UPI0008522E55|nr:PREDICTED: uncharacterized protein LOC108777868 [Cyphomyrmex costatus]